LEVASFTISQFLTVLAYFIHFLFIQFFFLELTENFQVLQKSEKIVFTWLEGLDHYGLISYPVDFPEL